ncbi:hypothetical protein [Leisingera sp. S232]|uniref:hypothetical protein n=1 Tax=Leisingera sp. S232 TaxID=3415132 RepID=UPI003C7B3BCA
MGAVYTQLSLGERRKIETLSHHGVVQHKGIGLRQRRFDIAQGYPTVFGEHSACWMHGALLFVSFVGARSKEMPLAAAAACEPVWWVAGY